MVRVAICEDSHNEVAYIKEYLKLYSDSHPQIQVQVDSFGNAEALLATIEHGADFNLYLFDILMPGMDGISLSRVLREDGRKGAIIFLTASRDFALEAYGVKAIDYLVKPVSAEALYTALDNAFALLDSRSDVHYTMVRMADADRMVRLDHIVAVEVQGHTLCYFLTNGEQLKSKVLRVSFRNATTDLTEKGRFIQPHQSFLINTEHVVSISKRKFTMDNGMEIPISRLRFAEVKAEYMHYLSPG